MPVAERAKGGECGRVELGDPDGDRLLDVVHLHIGLEGGAVAFHWPLLESGEAGPDVGGVVRLVLGEADLDRAAVYPQADRSPRPVAPALKPLQLPRRGTPARIDSRRGIRRTQ